MDKVAPFLGSGLVLAGGMAQAQDTASVEELVLKNLDLEACVSQVMNETGAPEIVFNLDAGQTIVATTVQDVGLVLRYHISLAPGVPDRMEQARNQAQADCPGRLRA